MLIICPTTSFGRYLRCLSLKDSSFSVLLCQLHLLLLLLDQFCRNLLLLMFCVVTLKTKWHFCKDPLCLQRSAKIHCLQRSTLFSQCDRQAEWWLYKKWVSEIKHKTIALICCMTSGVVFIWWYCDDKTTQAKKISIHQLSMHATEIMQWDKLQPNNKFNISFFVGFQINL